ncbi:hypothetical protein CAP35_04460 [Chitinophagaceae bacterium IBVUCB1]|nr:hypothetical protein CAP35_04460 [Chitinophagaceae bacterium IBVUCB1]
MSDMKKALLLSLCLCLMGSFSIAQHKAWDGFGVEGYYIAGRAFKHSKKIKADFPSYSPAFELNLVQQTYGRKAWHQRRRYPLVGLSISYTQYDGGEVYGSCIGINPNIRIPLIISGRFEWSLRAGYGLGYVSKGFSRFPSFDTLNTAMSTRINNYSYFTTDIRYRVNQHLDVLAGLNFAHVSNAALRQPNLGINKYGAHIGLRYSPVNNNPERIQRENNTLPNRWLVQARFSMAGTEMSAADGPMYSIYLVSAFASKRYWSKNKVYAGLDYEYHTGIAAFLKNNEIYPGKEKQNAWKSSVFVGNEFLVGRLGIIFQLGYYLKKHALKGSSLYQKLGGNVYLIQSEKGILKELTLHAYLKTHNAEAELAEAGIGIGF